MRGGVCVISYSESGSDACDLYWRLRAFTGFHRASESRAAGGRTGHRGQPAFYRASGKLASWTACWSRLLPVSLNYAISRRTSWIVAKVFSREFRELREWVAQSCWRY